jgi:putative heme iron utilization protein
MNAGMTAAVEARRFVRTRHAGVLSTLSQRVAGYPFGSVMPFVLDHEGRPVFIASRLAEHTRNLAADGRSSLLVQAEAEDVQSAARATIVGDCVSFEADAAMRDRFIRYHPDAADHLALGDFGFYRIRPVGVRFIGGFARIHWVGPEAWQPPANALAEAESSIVQHMNEDHADALRTYAARGGVHDGKDVAMIGIDVDGIDLRVDARVMRIEFDAPALDAGDARRALVAMARAKS